MSAVAGPLRISAVVTIIVSIVLGLTVAPIIFIGVAVGVIDLVLAMAFSRGWIGRPTTGDDTAARVEVDPAYNPYARED
jgi:hypothetical protein